VSLRARLILAAAYLLAVVVVVLEIPLGLNIGSRAVSEFQSTVLGNSAILASQISDDVATSQPTATAPEPPAGIGEAVRAAASRTESRILVVNLVGRVLADSQEAAPVGSVFSSTERPELLAALAGRIDISRRFSDTLGTELLLVAVPILHNGGVIGAVRVSESLGAVNARVHRAWLGLAGIGLAVIVVGLALAWFLATTLARPVRRLEETAVRFGQGDLTARAEPTGPKEVATLAGSFNRMAGALSANLTAQREFVANASHQLRTPLTGIKLRLEAIEAEGGFAGQQAAKADLEVDRLALLVDDLLELAKAASSESVGERVDLVDVARAAIERWTGPAIQAGKRVAAETAGSCAVWANRDDLGHIVDNLVENSVRYTPPGTEITIAARPAESGDGPALSVRDDGPGIPDEDRERVFERFFRGSAGRRSGPGTGLGMAIVAELVARWGGRIRLADGPGTCVEAVFPRPPAEP
jgi:signal transduction histidine kinase